MPPFIAFIAFIAITAAVAAIGALTPPGPWYATLAKPGWTPPDWLFGPVWGVLYLMIAIAGWLAWRRAGFGPLVGLWALQLALNGAWSVLMFGRHEIALALVDIIALLVAIIAFALIAWPVAPIAALLFIPYAAWVGFATALNVAIWRLNG